MTYLFFAFSSKQILELHTYLVQVRIVLEGVDKFSNLTGSVFYQDGESLKDLALELVENVSQFIMLMWSHSVFLFSKPLIMQ